MGRGAHIRATLPGRARLEPNDRPEPPTEVEIQFEAAGDGTIVRLEHRGWDKLGDRAAEAREGHDGGWQLPLERFVAAAG